MRVPSLLGGLFLLSLSMFGLVWGEFSTYCTNYKFDRKKCTLEAKCKTNKGIKEDSNDRHTTKIEYLWFAGWKWPMGDTEMKQIDV
ncbi:hypothetical protein N0V85_001876 [Neurospora sp. IMI 360204]|nr:hypothetical protein N0V85_001876 [Neurospora sp. IMI 360204]